MAFTFQITGGRQVENGWTVEYTINGVPGQGQVWGSKEMFIDWVSSKQDREHLADMMLVLAVSIWQTLDPTTNPATILGHTLTLDLTKANVLVRT